MIDISKQDYGFKDYFGLKKSSFPHKYMVKLAKNDKYKTEELVKFATEIIQYENKHKDLLRPNLALGVLQQRTNSEVLEKVRVLCNSSNPAERMLGAKILREFPGLDFEKPFVAEALDILQKRVEEEQDPEIRDWNIAAICWQKDPRAIPLLIKFVDHSDKDMRRLIASNLIFNTAQQNFFQPEIAKAYQKLCQDSYLETRWYAYTVLADVLEEGWPIFDPQQRSELEALLRIGLEDEDAEVRKEAKRALFFLHHPPPSSDLSDS